MKNCGDLSKAARKINKFRKRKKKSRTKARRKRRLKAKLLKGFPGTPRPRPKALQQPSYTLGPPTMSGQCYWLNYIDVFKWHAFHSSDRNSPSIYQMPGLLGRSSAHEFQDAVDHSGEAQLTEDDEDEDVEEESDDDIVVTEEMMQFLEISMRHKASMKAKKEEAVPSLKEEEVSERNAIDDCQQPEEDDTAEKRRLELNILYGRDAPTIHGMETATQLTFNRAVDVFNPAYWPVHPFTMQFKANK